MKNQIKLFFPNLAIQGLISIRDLLKTIVQTPAHRRGFSFATNWKTTSNFRDGRGDEIGEQLTHNPLRDYFNNHDEGPGIWKWEHYFSIYHRHFAKFQGRQAKVLEIGIYSGGSLEMWRAYFGEKSHVFGVDIERACEVYRSESTSIFIGDQADPEFWDEFICQAGGIDILIDDGGHSPEQQMVTLEKMLPNIRPGGVYLCEDIQGINNRFSEFACGLICKLNSQDRDSITPFQSEIDSIHFYPFVMVIEKREKTLERLHAPKKGTMWQPFFK